MYYVYLIKSLTHENKIYIGITNDLKERFRKHNKGGSPHTAKYAPWKMHAYFAFSSKEIAVAFEKYLKSGSGYSFSKRHFL